MVEQALLTALDYERRVRDLYRDAATKTTDESGRALLDALAGEEQEHVAYLKQCLDQWLAEGRIEVARLETVVPSREVIEAGLQSLAVDSGSPPERSVELDLLRQALEAEHETAAFYERMVAELDEPGRELFAPFLEIEQGHAAIVQAEIDALTGTGFWFDFAEFRLEA